MVTYTQLRNGNWGIRSTGQLTVGGSILVSKKSGQTKTETVGALVWSGNGVWLYAIGGSMASRPPQGGSVRARYRSRHGWDGVVGSSSYYSSGLYDEES